MKLVLCFATQGYDHKGSLGVATPKIGFEPPRNANTFYSLNSSYHAFTSVY
ncbi:MAG TPA: hypothetical protein PLT04_04330 [Candidatus Saccharibacteria bacterium]|nr:hypothetical protein [Candidatus Saccharibacteria bacterium]